MHAHPTLNMTIPLNLFDGSKDHNRGGTDIESRDEVVDDQNMELASVQFGFHVIALLSKAHSRRRQQS